MPTQVQRRGGTTAEHTSFTGAPRELTVDTDKNTVVVHNGAKAGGFPLALEENQMVAATTAEVNSLSTSQLAALTPSSLNTLVAGSAVSGTEQIAAIQSGQLVYLTQEQLLGKTIQGSTAGNLIRRFRLDITGQGSGNITCAIVLSGYGYNAAGFMSTTESASFTKSGSDTVGVGAEAVTYSLDAGGNVLTVDLIENVTQCQGAIMRTSGNAKQALIQVSGGNINVLFYDSSGAPFDISTLTAAQVFILSLDCVIGGVV